MKAVVLCCFTAVCTLSFTASAQTPIPLLESGTNKFTNVVVWQTNVSDIFVKHAGGMGNIKLKTLSPEWQTKFSYDAAKSEADEKKRSEATAQYHAALAAQKTKPQPAAATPAPVVSERGVRAAAPRTPAPQISAKRFLGQKAPELYVENWLGKRPNTAGKFVLIDFWATWCPPCRKTIPELNNFHKKFGDQLVVIGLSDETEQAVRALKSPKIEYFLAVDTRGRTKSIAQVTGIPHVMIIDPQGIVRWEGFPLLNSHKLTEQVVADVLAGN